MNQVSLQYFPPVAPGEKNVLSFNFAAGLASGNTLSGTPTVTVTTLVGTDTNPSGILNGAASLDSTNTIVNVPFYAQNDQNQYLVTVLCGTQNAQVLPGLSGVLVVNSLSGA